MKRNLIYIIGVVCMMTSCLRGVDTPNPLKGNEVLFTAALDGVQTKTLYGEQYKNADGKDVLKVNWVHNDLITVFGTECTAVPQAEYRVATVTVDDNGNETPTQGMNSASYLQKTGDAGVQWGENSESEFYAVYPSTANEFTKTDNGAKVVSYIRPVQRNVFAFDKESKTWIGTPYVQNLNNPTMQDAIMTAKTRATVEGPTVDLNFKPIATVLKFRFEGFNYTTNVGVDQATVYVNSITLQAPPNVYICGDFDLSIGTNGEATATPYGQSSADPYALVNSITIQPSSLPLSAGDAVEFSVYTIPQKGLILGTTEGEDLWKVKIETISGASFTYMMRPSSGKAELAAGKIHNVNIPALKIDKPGDMSGSEPNWIEKIPRNVYLSELSLPGAWYCTDEYYSGTADLELLYKSGIRAFHINCCLNTNGKLVCAGSNGSVTNEEVVAKLEKLNGLVTSRNKEYIVVVLSIAERADNGSVLPSKVLPKIHEILKSGTLSNLYGNGTDRNGNPEKISANTTVADVCGKMIVLINSNTNALPSSYLTGPALIAEASLAIAPDSNNNIVEGGFTSMLYSPLYWGNNSAGLGYYYHHAQGTTNDDSSLLDELLDAWFGSYDHPTIQNRKDAISSIISESDEIYLNGNHDAWYMMGIGGYLIQLDNGLGDILGGMFGEESSWVGNTTELANKLNKHLLDKINNKLRKVEGFYPSPVGIVLMNDPLNINCTQARTDSYGPELITAIINMNAAFLLESDPTIDPGTGESVLDIEAGFADVTSWEDVYLN